VRDREAVRAALDGVEMVYHQAAAVGVAQSMYEIEAYVSANSLGAAVLLQEVVARKGQIGRMVVASSMSIYGEGAYVDADGKRSRPRPDLSSRSTNGAAAVAAAVAAVSARDKALPTSVYAVIKRDHEELFLRSATPPIPTVALRY
jgi:dTDP-L-rhamnose 4-epimerase